MNHPNIPPPVDPRDETPDSLMQIFRGRNLVNIVIFTLIVHVVVLGGSSVPFLMEKIFAGNTAELSEEQRIKAAVAEVTPKLREIAEKHGLNPQQLSGQFAGGGSRTTKVTDQGPDAAPDTPATPATNTQDPAPGEAEKPKSELEKELDVTVEGPKQPSLDEEEDIF